MLTCDTPAAIDFLRTFAPEGPWCLTAINPDKKGLETRTFRPGDTEECERWISERNGKLNLYFHVNPVLGLLTKKAEREQIAALTYLHVDIDPKKGVDIDGEQQRILGLLTVGLKKLQLPIPTFVTFSGGGYQAFWKLDQPLQINGQLTVAEDVKLYNKQLEILFHADNCHNIDRIMRLPGTVNLPDKKKRDAGRVPVLARIVQDNLASGAVYPIERFTKAVLNAADAKSQDLTVGISGNVRRITDLNELDDYSVPNRTKIVIAQGKDPDEPLTGDNSRSAWLWYAVCELARRDVPADLIYGIITDPDWPISASVLDKGRSADADARRQIARAIQFADNPALLEMNERHFCCMIGSKFRIMTRTWDDGAKREVWTPWEKAAFKDHYETAEVEIGRDKDGKPIMANKAEWWLGNRKRRQYDGIVFAPDSGIEVRNLYNLWSGFAVDARPGECSLFFEHMEKVLCGGDKALYDYLIGWLARMVQEPGKPGEVAVVMRGERGAGKSFFANQVGALLGRHYLQVSNSQHLVGNFNAHLQEVILLFADEAFFAGDKRHESVLKTIITEPKLMIERKGINAEPARNCIHLIMASNDFHVIPVGRKERRFLVLDVSDVKAQQHDWFARIADQMDNGGREALLHYLLQYDISEFNVRAVPQTEELRKQQRMGLSHTEAWWKKQLEDGSLGGMVWSEAVLRDRLFKHYYEKAQEERVQRPLNNQALGIWLHDNVRGIHTMRRDVKIDVDTGNGFYAEKVLPRQYHYVFPSLDECRAQWEAKWGKEDWPETES